MRVYLDDIVAGLIVFPFLALVITVPFMVYQYRKFGSIPWWRTTIIYLFVFYLLCAYFLVILPLPESRTAVVPYAQHPQLVPFNFIIDFLNGSGLDPADPRSWLRSVGASSFYEVFFNVLLLMPFGMVLRYYFQRTWWQTVLLGFSVSLFFELSQLTGLFGLYEHPYRLFDVDDLITNTFGALLGFWVMGPAVKRLPRMVMLNHEAREQGVRVSLTRRALAFLIDLFLAGISVALYHLVLALIGLIVPSGEVGLGGITLFSIEQVISLTLFFVVVPSLTHGQTLGQKMLKLVIVKADAQQASWYQYLARYGSLFLILSLPVWLLTWLLALKPGEASDVSSIAELFSMLQPLLPLIGLVLGLLWVLSVLVRNRHAKKEGHLFTMLNELVSGTRIMTTEGVSLLHDRTVVLDVAEVVALEKLIDEEELPLIDLMEKAGLSVVDVITERNDDPTSVLVVCGSGNNGGDGWVVAHALATKGYAVKLITPRLPDLLEAEPARTMAMRVFADGNAKDLPLRVLVSPPDEVLEKELEQAEVVVDAILGTGFSGTTIREPYASWIHEMNKHSARRKDSYLVSIDVPSGYSAQCGTHAKPCIVADITVTMLAFKPGLIAHDAEHFCGVVKLARLIDITPYLERIESSDPDTRKGKST